MVMVAGAVARNNDVFINGYRDGLVAFIMVDNHQDNLHSDCVYP